jgi:hypothetical protein
VAAIREQGHAQMLSYPPLSRSPVSVTMPWRMFVEWSGTAAWSGALTGLLAASLSIWTWILFINTRHKGHCGAAYYECAHAAADKLTAPMAPFVASALGAPTPAEPEACQNDVHRIFLRSQRSMYFRAIS